MNYHPSNITPSHQPTQTTIQFINNNTFTFPNNVVNVPQQPIQFQPLFDLTSNSGQPSSSRRHDQKRNVNQAVGNGTNQPYLRNIRQARPTNSTGTNDGGQGTNQQVPTSGNPSNTPTTNSSVHQGHPTNAT